MPCIGPARPDQNRRVCGDSGVRGEEPMRPLSQIDVPGWPDHQMDVVRHDARTDDRQWSMVVRFGNEPEKCAVIGAIMESLQLIVATIDDVIIVVGNDRA